MGGEITMSMTVESDTRNDVDRDARGAANGDSGGASRNVLMEEVPPAPAPGIVPSVPPRSVQAEPCQPSFLAALVEIGPALPTIAATATVFAYVGGPTPLADDVQKVPLLAGAVAALVIGCVVAIAYYYAYTAADRAYPQSYAEIRQRVDRLGARLRVLERLPRSALSASEAIAFEEAATYFQILERDLVQGGSQWVSGSGYVDVLTRLHRAEEALITIEPIEDVIAAAYYDEQRIHGSTIGDRDDLLERLRTAVQALSPSGSVYLNELPTTTTLPNGKPNPARDPVMAARAADVTAGISGTTTAPAPAALTPPPNGVASGTPPPTTGSVPAAGPDVASASTKEGAAPASSTSTAPAATTEQPGSQASTQSPPDKQPLSPASRKLVAAEARIALREVRHALNDFRDASRSGLVQARSGIVGTMSLTGIITYVLLAFAINLNHKSQGLSDPIAAAGVLYFVGAVVGLFNRLYVESGDDNAVEDYGLSRTRTVLTPMLSGLAAVGGVLLTGMLAGVVDVSLITPNNPVAAATATAAAAVAATATAATTVIATATPVATAVAGAATPAAPPSPQVTTIGLIFNLQSFPFAVVLAAVFGLAPRLLLERLQNVSEQTRQNLKSTQANGSAASSAGNQAGAGKG
jgi:hypothetical protein